MNALRPVRRIVTGHNREGRAVISMDGAPLIYPLKAVPGTVFHEVWNSASIPVRIDNAPDPTLKPLQLRPQACGSLIRIVDIPPDSLQNAISREAASAAFAEIGAAHAEVADSRHRLMHRTETLDYGILISGELWLMLDEDEVRLEPGDIVIQRGTNHAWSNRTEEMARMIFVLLDGRYAEELKAHTP
jgi:hypothetical protein